jgi:hypothetical protein
VEVAVVQPKIEVIDYGCGGRQTPDCSGERVRNAIDHASLRLLRFFTAP